MPREKTRTRRCHNHVLPRKCQNRWERERVAGGGEGADADADAGRAGAGADAGGEAREVAVEEGKGM